MFICIIIRDVFQCSVMICFWRVRHAWHKHLAKNCIGNDMRVEISRRLEQIVNRICSGQGTISLFENFMEDFVDESDFMDYFKATWYPRLGKSRYIFLQEITWLLIFSKPDW